MRDIIFTPECFNAIKATQISLRQVNSLMAPSMVALGKSIAPYKKLRFNQDVLQTMTALSDVAKQAELAWINNADSINKVMNSYKVFDDHVSGILKAIPTPTNTPIAIKLALQYQKFPFLVRV